MKPEAFNQKWMKQPRKDRKTVNIYNNELV